MRDSDPLIRRLLTSLLFASLLVVGLGGTAHAQPATSALPVFAADEPELLPPSEAFRFEVLRRGDTLRLQVSVADGYYLYRDRLSLAPGTADLELGTVLKPEGRPQVDPLFGEVQVYRGITSVDVPVVSAGAAGALSLSVTSQGCADIGVCYPPDTRLIQVAAAGGIAPGPGGGAALSSVSSAASGGLSRLGDLFAGGSGEPQFLSVDEAFALRVVPGDAGAVRVVFDAAPGYYLYRSKMGFRVTDPATAGTGAAQMPEGTLKVDDYFGEQRVFYGGVTATVPVSGVAAGVPIAVQVSYQGCADAGLCYPPQERIVPVVMGAASAQGPAATVAPASGVAVLSETDRLAASLMRDALGWVLVSFFVAGVLLAFTPCVLPMVPILSAIIAGQQGPPSGRRGLALAAVYVLAMSLTYTAAGVVAGLFGQSLQALFQDPVVLVAFSVVFVLLAAAMFGVYELQLPVSLQTRLTALSHGQRGGRYLGVGAMGVLSALIVGPCVAAPLAAALIVIGSTGDPVRGGMALFALSLGMGVPLLAVGAFGPSLLPRAGAWMVLVRHLFGVMLLAVAIYLLSRILPDAVTLALWAVLALATAAVVVFSGRGAGPAARPGKPRVLTGGAIAVYALVLAVGAFTGGVDPLKPLAGIGRDAHATLAFQRVKTVQELDGVIADARRQGRPVMLDFYADWCVSCKEMERSTFTDASVQSALRDTVLLQADVTVYDDADKALLERFGLHGPPAILFFGADGRERRGFRVIGFMDALEFRPHVRRANRS